MCFPGRPCSGQELERSGKVISRGDAVIIVFIFATLTVIGLVGLTGIVAPIAKAALLLVPTIFAISLAVGFASRRQNWFR